MACNTARPIHNSPDANLGLLPPRAHTTYNNFTSGELYGTNEREQPYLFTYGVHKGKTFDKIPPAVLRDLDRMINDPKNTTLKNIPSLGLAFKKKFPLGYAHHEAEMAVQYKLDDYRLTFGLLRGKRFDELPHSILQDLADMIKDPNNGVKHITGLVEAFKHKYPREYIGVDGKARGYNKAQEKQPGMTYAVQQQFSEEKDPLWQKKIDEYKMEFGQCKGMHIDKVLKAYRKELEVNTDLLGRCEMLKHVLKDRNVRFGRSNDKLENTLKSVGQDLQGVVMVDDITQGGTTLDLWQQKIREYKLNFGVHKGKHIDEVPQQYVAHLTDHTDLLQKHEMLKYVLKDWYVRFGLCGTKFEKTLKRMEAPAEL